MADEATKKDETAALAEEGEEEALLGLSEAGDDDAPAPETGLHALGQLGTAVLVVGVVLVVFFVVALAFGWIFN